MIRFPLLIAPVIATLLPGCTTVAEGDFPSLAKRPYETSAPLGSTESASLPDQQPVSPALVQRLSTLRGVAMAAHNRFNQQRGSGAGGSDWASGQIAIAGLESIRSEAMIPLADLDRLYVAAYDAAVVSKQFADVEAIARTRADVARMIAEEDRAIAAMGRR